MTAHAATRPSFPSRAAYTNRPSPEATTNDGLAAAATSTGGAEALRPEVDDAERRSVAAQGEPRHDSSSASRSARLTADTTASSEAVTIDESSPTPQRTRSPTAHST